MIQAENIIIIYRVVIYVRYFYNRKKFSNLKEIILKHLSFAIDYYGEKESCSLFRKHLCWYSAGMTGSSEFRNKINRINNVEDLIAEIEKFF